MSSYKRRFIFVDFNNLKEVKFKKLDKICDKVFIFINADEQNIPFDLVLHLQKMGKSVKWILVKPSEHGELNYVISFMMGRLHQKIDELIEFAVLSNDPSFDSVVSFINSSGRSCLRVKRDKLPKEKRKIQHQPAPAQEIFEEKIEQVQEQRNVEYNNIAEGQPKAGYIAQEEEEAIERSAENTINRLIRSGNRPSDVGMLKDYIITNNHGLIFNNNAVDKVIKRLETSQEIEVSDEEVVYHF